MHIREHRGVHGNHQYQFDGHWPQLDEPLLHQPDHWLHWKQRQRDRPTHPIKRVLLSWIDGRFTGYLLSGLRAPGLYIEVLRSEAPKLHHQHDIQKTAEDLKCHKQDIQSRRGGQLRVGGCTEGSEHSWKHGVPDSVPTCHSGMLLFSLLLPWTLFPVRCRDFRDCILNQHHSDQDVSQASKEVHGLQGRKTQHHYRESQQHQDAQAILMDRIIREHHRREAWQGDVSLLE